MRAMRAVARALRAAGRGIDAGSVARSLRPAWALAYARKGEEVRVLPLLASARASAAAFSHRVLSAVASPVGLVPSTNWLRRTIAPIGAHGT